jgi:hypothetical protein
VSLCPAPRWALPLGCGFKMLVTVSDMPSALRFLGVAALAVAVTAVAAVEAQGSQQRPAAAVGGVTLTMWNNTAMAGDGHSESGSPLAVRWRARRGGVSAEWLGSLTPSTTGSYRFNCTFEAGFGLAWIDGHIFCSHGLPAYAHDVGPAKIELTAGKPIPVRMQFLVNTSGTVDAAATMLWSASATAPLEPIDPAVLSPQLPSDGQHQRMAALQREQFARSGGWGSWYPYNLIQVTRCARGVVPGLLPGLLACWPAACCLLTPPRGRVRWRLWATSAVCLMAPSWSSASASSRQVHASCKPATRPTACGWWVPALPPPS